MEKDSTEPMKAGLGFGHDDTGREQLTFRSRATWLSPRGPTGQLPQELPVLHHGARRPFMHALPYTGARDRLDTLKFSVR
jgi:hypothetical protein